MKAKKGLEKILSAVVLLLLAICGLTLGVKYIDVTKVGFLIENKKLVKILLSVIIVILTVISFIFQLNDNKFALKLTIIFLVLLSVVFAGLYVLKISGLDEKISNVESLRSYVSSYGNLIVPVFISLQFLQVLFLPIPSIVLHSSGIALFGFELGVTYSVLGVVTASIIAFFIGKKLGVQAVKWLIGEDNLNRGLALIKGRDKLFLTVAFLFPFFPDDLLCFVAGVSGVSTKFFIVMVSVTRAIEITVTSFFVSGKFLSLTSWIGFVILLIFLAITVIICIIIYKRLFKSAKGA